MGWSLGRIGMAWHSQGLYRKHVSAEGCIKESDPSSHMFEWSIPGCESKASLMCRIFSNNVVDPSDSSRFSPVDSSWRRISNDFSSTKVRYVKLRN